MYQFEKLDVWTGALDVIKAVYKLIDKFPERERFALGNQLQRSVTSIALNIAEGRGLSNDREFRKYLRIALGSLFETVASLKVSIVLEYISNDDAKKTFELLDMEGAKLKALIKHLNGVGNGK